MEESTININSIDIIDKVAAETDKFPADIKAVFEATHKVVVNELLEQKKRIKSGVSASEIATIIIPGLVSFYLGKSLSKTHGTVYGINTGTNKLLITEVCLMEEEEPKHE